MQSIGSGSTCLRRRLMHLLLIEMQNLMWFLFALSAESLWCVAASRKAIGRERRCGAARVSQDAAE